VIGALATVNATSDVQPVDAVRVFCMRKRRLVTAAAGHRPVPQRQNRARRSGGCVWTRQRAHVFVALCVAEHNGRFACQTWAAGVLPQGFPPAAAVALTLTHELCRARLTSSKEKTCTKRSAHHTLALFFELARL